MKTQLNKALNYPHDSYEDKDGSIGREHLGFRRAYNRLVQDEFERLIRNNGAPVKFEYCHLDVPARDKVDLNTSADSIAVLQKNMVMLANVVINAPHQGRVIDFDCALPGLDPIKIQAFIIGNQLKMRLKTNLSGYRLLKNDLQFLTKRITDVTGKAVTISLGLKGNRSESI